MTETGEPSSRGLTEAVVIALLSIIGYWLTFRYEASYLQYYGVPSQMVEISLKTAFVGILAVSGASLLLFWIINMISLSLPDESALREKLFRIVFVLMFPLWHLLMYGFRSSDWILYVVSIAAVVLVEYLWPLFVFKDKGRLRERFIADEIAEAPKREKLISGRIYRSLGPFAYGLFLICWFGSALASTAGRAKAETQKFYLVLADDPELAVVRLLPDSVIFKRIDRSTKVMHAEISMQKLESERLRLFEDANLGPLVQKKSVPKVD